MPLPDYRGGSIVNLMATLVMALGGGGVDYPMLTTLEPAAIAKRRHVLLLVIDGLGYEHLAQTVAGNTLRRGLRASMTSVFPSTTATAITTFLTATAPQQHGLTGWFTYFSELGSVIAVLPFQDRHGGPGLERNGIDAGRLFDHKPVFDRIPRRSCVVAPERIIDSAFNVAHSGGALRRGYTTLPQFFDIIDKCMNCSTEPTFTYAYWPHLDRLAHEHGIASTQVEMHLDELDAGFSVFINSVRGRDSIVIVTGDHGFIDTTPEALVSLDAHPALAETLLLPLCGEQRAAFCYVHPDRCTLFEDYVATHLAREATLLRSEQVLRDGYFGVGVPHPRLRDRIGHYVLLMNHNFVIKDWIVGEHRYAHVGVHGGVSNQEMFVPLIVVEP